MAKQIEGVYEKVYECAKKEFLNKGFKDASLRNIAQEAGTSTGSIYTRFHNKEGLFHAMVYPVVEELKEWFLRMQESFHQLDADYQKENMFYYSGTEAERLVSYIYDHYDVFNERITTEFLHIVTSAYFSGIFEMVRHDMKREDGMLYAKQLREFYYAGFAKIYNWK